MTNNKKNIFITGGTGLIGSRIVELLADKFNFTNLSTSTRVDITRPESLNIITDDTDHMTVLHLAAKTDVDGCERDKALGEDGDAYKINVNGTRNVVDACRKSNKKIIYISTDFIFNGENTPSGGYKEEYKPDPVNWYAQTKYLGEEIIKNSGLQFVIARIAYPYRKNFALKSDFVRAIRDRLKKNLPVAAVTDHIFCPTYIDDISFALEKLIDTDLEGIYHVTGSQSLTPFEASVKIAENFALDKKLISQTTRSDFFKNRAIRPFNLTLNNAKIKKLGIEMKGFEEGLKEISNY